MNLNPFGRFGVPDLEKILANPKDYSRIRTKKSVQRVMSKYYRLAWLKLDMIGPAVDQATLATRAVNQVSVEINEGNIGDLAVAKGRLSFIFDNELLAYARSNRQAYERVLGLWQVACHFLVDQDPKAKKTCRLRTEREDAYRTAMAKLAAKISNPTFKFKNGASIYLRKIFRDECVNIRRGQNGKQSTFEDGRISFGDELPYDAACKLYPPTELLSADLKMLRTAHPRCFNLYYQVIVIGMKYQELELKFGKPAKALKNEAYRCKEKLKRAFQRLTN